MYLEIDRSSRNPIRNQLYEQLLKRILSGELSPGTQMPSSRYLHEKLNISRNLILEVYEQLAAEGYLEGRHGKGTWVSQNVILGSYVERRNEPVVNRPKNGERDDIVRFTCGIPDLRNFPIKKWRHSLDYVWSLADLRTLSYPPVNGREELRNEIADYLLLTKGIRTTPECVVVTSGTAESLYLLATHFASRTGELIIEDPVIDFASGIFLQTGYRLRHVPVDEWGLDIRQLPESPGGKLLFVSPSHQFPLGVVLSASRRVALIDYAVRHCMFIIEDDYDSEFRYEGQPLRSLFLMNPEIVIHMGTFSKNMIPALRLGYMVLPAVIAPEVIATKERLNMRTHCETQLAMAHFMRSGQFVRHIAAMKRMYRRKYELLCRELHDSFGTDITINANPAGLHLCMRHHMRDFTVEEANSLRDYGVLIDCEAAYSSSKNAGGLILGFGNIEETKIAEGVTRLKRGISALLQE